MLDKNDEPSPTPAQDVTRDSMPENVTRDRMSLRVSDQLLDLMAADDESRHLAALKSLEEKRKITRAEMYLRNKFRNKLVHFLLSENRLCATLDRATHDKLLALVSEEHPKQSNVTVDQRASDGERSSQGEKRKRTEAEEVEEEASASCVEYGVRDEKSSAATTGKCTSSSQT